MYHGDLTPFPTTFEIARISAQPTPSETTYFVLSRLFLSGTWLIATVPDSTCESGTNFAAKPWPVKCNPYPFCGGLLKVRPKSE